MIVNIASRGESDLTCARTLRRDVSEERGCEDDCVIRHYYSCTYLDKKARVRQ